MAVVTPLLSLSPALRIAVAYLVSHLPANVSLAVGTNTEGSPPYYMDLRVGSGVFANNRARIGFDTEEQVMQGLVAVQVKLGIRMAPKPVEKVAPQFPDMAGELAALNVAPSIVV